MNIAEPMTSLYESLFDVDDNIDNVDRVHLIGEEYEIDVNDIRCTLWKNIYKVGILKVQPPRNFYKSPKIDKFEDPKENKLIEILCTIILNLPIELIDDRWSFRASIEPFIEPYEKFRFGRCHLSKNFAGDMHFYTTGKDVWVSEGNGIKVLKTPQIYIPLKRK